MPLRPKISDIGDTGVTAQIYRGNRKKMSVTQPLRSAPVGLPMQLYHFHGLLWIMNLSAYMCVDILGQNKAVQNIFYSSN